LGLTKYSMTKKIVSFINPNFQQGPLHLNAFYLPYTSGLLWSYASLFPEVTDNYVLGEFIWKRENIDEAVERLKDHHIIAISGYVWNRTYNHALATKLKEKNPDILIIAGGPEFPIEKPNFFELHPYVDYCVKSEGEYVFRDILIELTKDEPNIKSISGMLVNDNGNTFHTGESVRINNIDEIPSPYLTGVFDQLMKDNPEVTWNGIFETNRGCPYMCTFCDWGSLTYSKVKRFHLERVFDELEWFGKNKIDYISITDANFGMFPERDMEIACKLIEVRKKYSYPRTYTMTWAKNQKLAVIDIAAKFAEGGNKAGMQISIQSLSDPVLTAIKRKNLAINQIQETMKLCEERNIPVFSEIILGLPEETLESWKNNYYGIFEAGNHNTVHAWQALLLENSEMNLKQREQYNIEALKVYGTISGAHTSNDGLDEGIEVVVATNTMPKEDMIKALVFNWYITTFHLHGLTNWISRFLRTNRDIQYYEFYDKLFDYIQTDEWFNSEVKFIEENSKAWLETGQLLTNKTEAGPPLEWWNLVHTTMMNMQSQNKCEHVFKVIGEFVRSTYDLPQPLLDELLEFQEKSVIAHADMGKYPKFVELTHDIYGYVLGGELEKSATYRLDFALTADPDSPMNPETFPLDIFCDNYYYGKKQLFGKARITKI
jgi:putative methyltransferase